MSADPDDPCRTPGPAEADVRWASVSEMVAGSWVELPVDDDGPQRWLRVVATRPPSWTGEYRWALVVADETHEWWTKVAPHLVFRTVDGVSGCS